ncbi:hypothetical protein AsAng_0013990 [Aureispira anguillae]|uniref:Uncharacterized protein n=1 Tax=Aureispira anguillae TaxID=2864201 RepID=A0A916DRK0_9BACT|nr:hypothetical protein AsAng_0013900 [Aureispira anguillae]BDS10690.1 hypothetical protein AsAng_0013990 [Aureispira anguillae]
MNIYEQSKLGSYTLGYGFFYFLMVGMQAARRCMTSIKTYSRQGCNYYNEDKMCLSLAYRKRMEWQVLDRKIVLNYGE